jgi:hypothetical protein
MAGAGVARTRGLHTGSQRLRRERQCRLDGFWRQPWVGIDDLGDVSPAASFSRLTRSISDSQFKTGPLP